MSDALKRTSGGGGGQLGVINVHDGGEKVSSKRWVIKRRKFNYSLQ